MKIVTVIGARPQIIKAAGLSRAIATHFPNRIEEVIVHTGQHYDENMSEVFFGELGIPAPKYNLNVGSDFDGEQTSKMISGIEEVLRTEKPAAVILYGDTNSTLAGTKAASKLNVPIVHIEAGLRSFNENMPEEFNRVTCDHASTLLFSPTQAGLDNLETEGFKLAAIPPFTESNPGVFHCGDIMYDNSLYYAELSDERSQVLNALKLRHSDYVLATIHRNENTDNIDRLTALFEALLAITKQYGFPIVLPLHPRTKKQMEVLPEGLKARVIQNEKLMLIPPVSFLDMIALEKNAQLILTDSGGVQKEAFFFQKPCVILRNETEWVELVECGAAKLAGHDVETILIAFEQFLETNDRAFPSFFGDGQAGKFICEQLLKNFA
jgi:UDP-GlcNAc3NAcA epimerase